MVVLNEWPSLHGASRMAKANLESGIHRSSVVRGFWVDKRCQGDITLLVLIWSKECAFPGSEVTTQELVVK